MKVIGLDIATHTGWAIIEVGESSLKLQDRGTIVLDSKMDLSQRLRYFSVELSRVLEIHKPEWAFIEDVLLGMSGAKTLAYLARLNGVALNTCFTFLKDNVKLFQPAYWKKNSFPKLNGSAAKWEVQLASTEFFNFQLEKSFHESFLLRQKGFENELSFAKNNLDLKKRSVLKYKNDIQRKRNPLTAAEIDQTKELIKQEESIITEIKSKIISLEKDLDKYMTKISVDISAQTGISPDIADASGVALCGLRELKILC